MNVPAPAEHRRYCILTENMMEKGGGWVRQKDRDALGAGGREDTAVHY